LPIRSKSLMIKSIGLAILQKRMLDIIPVTGALMSHGV
jgi:hypothetical protein